MPSFLTALVLALAGSASAEPAPLPEGVRGVELIEGWSEPDGSRTAAIEIRLAPGWHTYWRVPGENGIPPQFDWSASKNLASVAYEWPRPEVFETYGAATIGYEDALVLPVRLRPVAAGAPMEVAVDLFFGVCRDLCAPVEARLTARLAPDAAPEGREAIERALAARPTEARAAGVAEARCTLRPGGDGHEVRAEIVLEAPPSPDVTAVIEAEARPGLWIGVTETRTEGRVVHATAPVGAASPGGIALDRRALRLTLIEERRAVDIRGCAGGN